MYFTFYLDGSFREDQAEGGFKELSKWCDGVSANTSHPEASLVQ